MDKFKSRLAAIVSIVFSPFFVIILAIILESQKYTASFWRFAVWAGIGIFFFSILPFFYFVCLMLQGKLSDIHISLREQRRGPLLFVLGSTAFGIGLLYLFQVEHVILWISISYIVCFIVFTTITYFWKISFHCGIASSWITALTLTLGTKMAPLFLLLPLIAWARIHRQRHTIPQVIVAIFLASAITALLLIVFGLERK